MKYIAILFLKLYKAFISPLLPKSCRYIPSCSDYAITSFKTHKFHIALFLVFKRVLSCHALSKKEMLDEVPKDFSFKDYLKEKIKRYKL